MCKKCCLRNVGSGRKGGDATPIPNSQELNQVFTQGLGIKYLRLICYNHMSLLTDQVSECCLLKCMHACWTHTLSHTQLQRSLSSKLLYSKAPSARKCDTRANRANECCSATVSNRYIITRFHSALTHTVGTLYVFPVCLRPSSVNYNLTFLLWLSRCRIILSPLQIQLSLCFSQD